MSTPAKGINDTAPNRLPDTNRLGGKPPPQTTLDRAGAASGRAGKERR